MSALQHAGRGLGYKPDMRHLLGAPFRNASRRLSAVPAPPPSSSLKSAVVSVLDQGAAPFCFAHSPAQAIRMRQVLRGVPNPRLASRLWLVYLTHALEHMPLAFDGAYLSDTFQVLEQMGFPPEDAWAYSDSQDGNFKVRPPAAVERLAYDRIAPIDYGRIVSNGDDRVDDVKKALAAGLPVSFGTQVTEAFCRGDLGPGFVANLPGPLDTIAGGHALTAVAHDDATGLIEVVNSWGANGWGNLGFFYMPYAYMAAPMTTDIWFSDFQGEQP